jgi:hypothetical protein
VIRKESKSNASLSQINYAKIKGTEFTLQSLLKSLNPKHYCNSSAADSEFSYFIINLPFDSNTSSKFRQSQYVRGTQSI